MKKIIKFVSALAFAGCVISCGGNAPAGNNQQNGTDPVKTEQKEDNSSVKEEKSDGEKTDLSKKYICPNRDFSTDEENAVCPTCGMEVIPN